MKIFKDRLKEYTRDENGYVIAPDVVTEETMDRVMQVKGVDKRTLTYEAVDEILAIFGLTDATDTEEVRAVRNSVVMYFSDIFDEFDNARKVSRSAVSDNLWDKFEKGQMWMSAITAALDHKIYSIDPRKV